MEPQEHSKGPGAQTLGDAGGVKGAYGGTWCIRGGSGRSTSSTRPTDPATRALEYGVLGPDGTGLESSMVETADESVGPALLDETTSGAGSDSPAAGGGRDAELDPLIPALFPKDDPVTGGVAVQQGGVAPRRKR